MAMMGFFSGMATCLLVLLSRGADAKDGIASSLRGLSLPPQRKDAAKTVVETSGLVEIDLKPNASKNGTLPYQHDGRVLTDAAKTFFETTRFDDITKQLDSLNEEIEKKRLKEKEATTSTKAGQAISSVTKQAVAFATAMNQCKEGSCNKGEMAGTSIALAGSVVAAVSALAPAGDLLVLVGGIIGALFGGSSGDTAPISMSEIGTEMHNQLVLYGAETFVQFKFPSLAQTSFASRINFFSGTAQEIGAMKDLSTPEANAYLKSFQTSFSQETDSLGQDIQIMQEGYLHAVSAGSDSMRSKLQTTQAFLDKCSETCGPHGSLCEMQPQTCRPPPNTCFDNLAVTGNGYWRQFKGLLQGYKALADMTASVHAAIKTIYNMTGWSSPSPSSALAGSATNQMKHFLATVGPMWDYVANIDSTWAKALTSCGSLYSQTCDCDEDSIKHQTCHCNYPLVYQIGMSPVCGGSCPDHDQTLFQTKGGNDCEHVLDAFNNVWDPATEKERRDSCGHSCWVHEKVWCARAEYCATSECKDSLSVTV